MDYGFVVGRPYLGVSTQDVSLSGYGFFTSTYTYPCIVSVEDGSAAQQAGLKKDDVIMAVNGDTVSSSDGLYIAVSKFKVGDTVTLTILRSNSQIDVSVTLGQRSTAKTAE
ncbi:MAG: S1C family serine protease [Christensenellaceae bacterium]|jgi:S1-C subfamily serine protease